MHGILANLKRMTITNNKVAASHSKIPFHTTHSRFI